MAEVGRLVPPGYSRSSWRALLADRRTPTHSCSVLSTSQKLGDLTPEGSDGGSTGDGMHTMLNSRIGYHLGFLLYRADVRSCPPSRCKPRLRWPGRDGKT